MEHLHGGETERSPKVTGKPEAGVKVRLARRPLRQGLEDTSVLAGVSNWLREDAGRPVEAVGLVPRD
jgi:hypothetical protein